MRKHISIFSFLLCAFAAVGLAGVARASAELWVLSDSPGKVTFSGSSWDLVKIRHGSLLRDRLRSGRRHYFECADARGVSFPWLVWYGRRGYDRRQDDI